MAFFFFFFFFKKRDENCLRFCGTLYSMVMKVISFDQIRCLFKLFY